MERDIPNAQQTSRIYQGALAGIPDDGVVQVAQLQKDPAVVRAAKLVRSNEGTGVWWMGDDRLTFQVLSDDTDGSYSFWIDEPEPGEGPPKHVHSREEEGFYVLSGEATFQAGHVQAALTPGAFIALPVGIPHKWVNTSNEKAKLITFTAPGGNEGFFLALGAPGSGQSTPRKTMAVEEINQHTLRFGVTYMETSANPMDGALVLGAGRSPTLIMPNEGDLRFSAKCVYNIKAAGPVTKNSYTLVEVELRKGGIMPSQRHAAFEEGIYVLEGSLRVQVDGQQFEMGAGDFLNIPWGASHELWNDGDALAKILSITVPGGLEDYLRAACRVTSHDSVDVQADIARMEKLGERFGIFKGLDKEDVRNEQSK